MNKYAEEWIEALESGEYKQGRNKLRTETTNGNEFCCLGVACEVMEKNGVHTDYEKYTAVPPLKVIQLLGLKPTSRPMTSLVEWNDSERLTFKEIAEILREKSSEFFLD